MGDKIIITEDEPKPSPEVIVVTADEKPRVEKVVAEKVTTVETRQN